MSASTGNHWVGVDLVVPDISLIAEFNFTSIFFGVDTTRLDWRAILEYCKSSTPLVVLKY